MSADSLVIVDSDGDRLVIGPAAYDPDSLFAIAGKGVYLTPADAQRLADWLTSQALDGMEAAPSDPPRPAATGEGGAGRGPNLDGTFTAGTKVHLTVEATVDEHGCYVIVTDSGKTWAQCPSGMSFIVTAEPAPAPPLPTKFGAVVRATVAGRRQVLVLANPAPADSGDLLEWFSPESHWQAPADLTDVEVLAQGIDEPPDLTRPRDTGDTR